MNELVLHGPLRERFGESFKLDVRDPGEAFRALAVQLPDFTRLTIDGNYVMVRELSNGQLALDVETLFLGMHDTRIHLLPMIEGAANGKGVGKLLAGVALVGASFFIPGSTALIAGLTLKTATLGLGLALAFGGAAMLLSPTPKFDDKEGDESYLFGGDVQTGVQNLAIPCHFGRVRVKLIPVSTEVRVNQIAVRKGQTYSNSPGGVGGGGGYQNQQRELSYNSVER